MNHEKRGDRRPGSLPAPVPIHAPPRTTRAHQRLFWFRTRGLVQSSETLGLLSPTRGNRVEPGFDSFRQERQLEQTHAYGVKERVGDESPHAGDCRFTAALRREFGIVDEYGRPRRTGFIVAWARQGQGGHRPKDPSSGVHQGIVSYTRERSGCLSRHASLCGLRGEICRPRDISQRDSVFSHGNKRRRDLRFPGPSYRPFRRL